MIFINKRIQFALFVYFYLVIYISNSLFCLAIPNLANISEKEIIVTDKIDKECESAPLPSDSESNSSDNEEDYDENDYQDEDDTDDESDETDENEDYNIENVDDEPSEQHGFIVTLHNFVDQNVDVYWEQSPNSDINDASFITSLNAMETGSVNTFSGHNFFVENKDLFSKTGGRLNFIASPANPDLYVTNDGISFTNPEKSNAKNSRYVEPRSTGMGAKFRNLSNKTVKKWYVPEVGEKVFQGVYGPGDEGTSATYYGHVFSFTDKNDDSKELIRFTMNPNQVLYAYIDEATADPEDLERHKAEVKFSEEYKNKTGRHWLAYYPKGPAQTFMWPCDFIGQKHTVTSKYGLKHTMEEEPGEATFTLECLSMEPRAFVILNFFSHEEADHLTSLGQGKYRRSAVGGSKADGGYGMTSDTRTSRNTWIPKESSSMTENLFLRVADLTKVESERLTKTSNYVEFQLLNYQKGQEYSPHHDWGVEGNPATRFLTLLLYLNNQASPDAGGETQFPKARVGKADGLTVHPGKGNAVLFYNQLPDGNVDDLALHAALPVRKGEKNLANFWIWDKFYGGVFEKRSKK